MAAFVMAGCGTADGEHIGAVEQDVGGAGGWVNIGPKGAIARYVPGGGANPVRYTGPIMDIELASAYFARIAAEGGGTFQKALNGTITPLSDDMCGAVNCLTTSTIATDPTATWRWLVGTSALWQAEWPDGQGVWLWDAALGIWRNVVPRADAGPNVYRIRFAPTAQAVVFAATSRGVWMSEGSGAGGTWTKVLPYSGDIDTTDLVTVREDASTTGVWVVNRGGAGPWYAQYTAGGLSAFVFRPIDCATGCDLTLAGREAVTASPANPGRVYVQVGSIRPGKPLLGVYRSDAYGVTASWVNVTPVDPDTRQYDWNNVIGASPVDSARLLACGYKCFWSTNAGASWTKMVAPNIPDPDHLHDDHHAIAWSDDGASVAVGNDGGFTWGTNANGAGPPSWDTWAHNVLPITEFFDADRPGAAASNVYQGAAWHTGTSATDDGGNTWYATQCCDGEDVLADVANTGRVWTIAGVGWDRYRNNNWGTTSPWEKIPLAPQVLPIADDQWPKIAHDNYPPVWLYANSGSQVWQSTDGGNSFGQFWTIPGAGSVQRVAVHAYPAECLYATRNVDSTNRFWVFTAGQWLERSNNGFVDPWPANDFVNRVVVHPQSATTAYVILHAANGDVNRRVYRTPDRGVNWENITWNLSTFVGLEVEIEDLAVDPQQPNVFYLATRTGVFQGSGGAWQRWNVGMPVAASVRSIRADVVGGTTWLTAGTYGRGLWIRDPRRRRPR